jgi:hypothetical protein
MTTLPVRVDRAAPELTLSCPAEVPWGADAHARWAASDGESGIAGETSGTVRLATEQSGLQTVTHSVADRTGHVTAALCDYEVGERPEPSPTASPVATPAATASPVATPAATASPVASPQATASPAATPTASASPTATPTPTASLTAAQLGLARAVGPKRMSVARSGIVRVRLACAGRCTGVLRLGAAKRSFDVTGRESIGLRLGKRARAQLWARGRLRAELVVRSAGQTKHRGVILYPSER